MSGDMWLMVGVCVCGVFLVFLVVVVFVVLILGGMVVG